MDVLKTVVQTWYFHRPLRAIVSWYTEMQDARANQTSRGTAAKAKLARDFMLAVDTDGDGGLSLCELKAAELGKAGAKNPEFAKISIWLQTGGNFKKYDKRGIGVIEESAFEDAINRFLDEHWKYEGVLW